MAKISPVSIKYMVHANFVVEGFLEKPDVIGALFGQTEGLLGSDLEMRELQKEGKIGRIEVELEKKEKRTLGNIKIPTALDQSETSLIAAAIETIERIGPCDAQIEVERIEDVRGSKREYIVDRAKNLMKNLQGLTSSREISTEIKSSTRAAGIEEYGEEKLPAGDLSDKEIIVVEGRADVVNLLRNGVSNVIGMNGTKLPAEVIKLGDEKELTLFVDGDRGGKLIAQNVLDNAKVEYVAIAPSGKEVEELTGKEIFQALRKKVPAKEFLLDDKRPAWQARSFSENSKRRNSYSGYESKESFSRDKEEKSIDKNELKKVFDKIRGSGKAVMLANDLSEIKTVSTRGLSNSLKNAKEKVGAVVIDGTATPAMMKSAERAGSRAVVAKNFTTTDTKMQLLSL